MQRKPCYCIEDDCDNPVHLPAPIPLPASADGILDPHYGLLFRVRRTRPDPEPFENFCTTLEPKR